MSEKLIYLRECLKNGDLLGDDHWLYLKTSLGFKGIRTVKMTREITEILNNDFRLFIILNKKIHDNNQKRNN
jgi:hypothetical protein